MADKMITKRSMEIVERPAKTSEENRKSSKRLEYNFFHVIRNNFEQRSHENEIIRQHLSRKRF